MTTLPNDDQADQTNDSARPKLNIATDKVSADFKDKMQEMRLADQEKAIEKEAKLLIMPYINLAAFAILPEAIGMVSEEDAKEASAVCFFKQEDTIRLATTKPNNPKLNEVVENFKKQDYAAEIYLISPHSLDRSLTFYKTIPKIKKIERGITISKDDLEKFKGQYTDLEDLANKT